MVLFGLCCKLYNVFRKLLLDIAFLQSIVFLLVNAQQDYCHYNGCHAKATEDAHGGGVAWVGLIDVSDEHGHHGQTNVLDIENDGVGGTQQLHRNNFGNARPHG